jgi:hypothetical protein
MLRRLSGHWRQPVQQTTQERPSFRATQLEVSLRHFDVPDHRLFITHHRCFPSPLGSRIPRNDRTQSTCALGTVCEIYAAPICQNTLMTNKPDAEWVCPRCQLEIEDFFELACRGCGSNLIEVFVDLCTQCDCIIDESDSDDQSDRGLCRQCQQMWESDNL